MTRDVPASSRLLIQLLCRKTIQLSSPTRIVTHTLLSSEVADSPVVVKVQEALKAYSTRAESNPGHGHGPPAVHVWGAVLDGLSLQLPSSSPSLALLREHRDSWDLLPAAEAAMVIREARIPVALKADDRKIILAVAPGPQALAALCLVIKALVETGWRLLQGPAPRDGLARQLEAALERSLRDRQD